VTTRATRDEQPAEGPRLRLLEGTLIEAVLANRLDGALAGPVDALVTGPVYSTRSPSRADSRRRPGARAATPVQSWGESRLAVSFHRLIMPDGHTYSLDRFKGLNAIGETGLRDRVNRHYLQVFGAVGGHWRDCGPGAIQHPQRIRRGLRRCLPAGRRRQPASSSARILDRYLERAADESPFAKAIGLKVYLTNDLDLPAYSPAPGGAP
jgi:type IV secretion system protein VirB10